MIHNARGGGENNVAELTGRQELDHPFLEIADADVVSRRDDTSLVEAMEVLVTADEHEPIVTYRPLS